MIEIDLKLETENFLLAGVLMTLSLDSLTEIS